ncbi:MAG TPA: hypothetical protein VMG40_17255 [Bryobacteraceae bacterium]|nr:hypothetical protein [Bryobacteraceae bacterium]
MQTEVEPLNASRRTEVMERLFTDLQVARFNQLYYQTRSKSVRGWMKRANVIAALSASAAFTGMLKNGGPLWLLQGFTIVAAISAAVGPVLGLEDKYAQLERASLGHAIAKDRIWSLLRDLKVSELTDSHEAREREIAAFREALSALDEEPHDSVRTKCWEQVERELPADKAWTII